MRASKNALDLIKRFEGCRLEAYEDLGGKVTIGYGTTGSGIVPGLTISERTANGMLIGDVGRLGEELSRLVGINVSQNQYDALISFVYNVGITAFRNSTMYKLIQEHKLYEAADEFLKWNKVDGKEVEGLKARREAERKLFMSTI